MFNVSPPRFVFQRTRDCGKACGIGNGCSFCHCSEAEQDRINVFEKQVGKYEEKLRKPMNQAGQSIARHNLSPACCLFRRKMSHLSFVIVLTY